MGCHITDLYPTNEVMTFTVPPTPEDDGDQENVYGRFLGAPGPEDDDDDNGNNNSFSAQA